MKRPIVVEYPLGPRVEPSLDTWKRLLALTRTFHTQAPWEVMTNSDIFAVVNPHSQEIGFCCVMGNGGMEFGLQVYLGMHGLRVFMDMANEKIAARELLFDMRCFGFSYGARDFLDKKDMAPLKNLVVSFMGGQWPCFRRSNPGYTPWYITEDEAQFLICCMEQALVVSADIDSGEFLDAEGKRLTRVSSHGAEGPVWKSEYRRFEPAKKTPVDSFIADEFSIATIARKTARKGLHWEVDCPPFHGQIGDTVPPRLLRLFACMESSRGLALGCDQALVEEPMHGSCNRLLAVLCEQEDKPSEIRFRRPELMQAASLFLQSVDIRPVGVERLPIVEELEATLASRFGG